jgi:FPC/CPF motif-containing protein YcgG
MDHNDEYNSKHSSQHRVAYFFKVSIYNCGIVSKELGFYGAEDNKEWQQYQLEEEGITRPTRCPFKKFISKK